MFARDIMQTEFHTLSPQDTIAEAVKKFQRAIEAEGKKVFGILSFPDAARFRSGSCRACTPSRFMQA
jgi:hypothetical protein